MSSSEAHFHVQWSKVGIVDRQPFNTWHEALEHALQAAHPGDLFTVEEVLSANCPVCGTKAASAN